MTEMTAKFELVKGATLYRYEDEGETPVAVAVTVERVYPQTFLAMRGTKFTRRLNDGRYAKDFTHYFGKHFYLFVDAGGRKVVTEQEHAAFNAVRIATAREAKLDEIRADFAKRAAGSESLMPLYRYMYEHTENRTDMRLVREALVGEFTGNQAEYVESVEDQLLDAKRELETLKRSMKAYAEHILSSVE